MKQMDDNIGYVLKKLEDMGQLDNTIVVFTTDNGAEAITFPDGGVTPFKGQKGEAWEGGYRAPMVIRWPGHIKPGTVKNQLFAALDWLPTLVEIAGGPKGDELKKQIEAGKYPGIVKTTLDGVNQRDYLEGKSEKSARDYLLLLSRERRRRRCGTRTGRCTTPCHNPGADGWLMPLTPVPLHSGSEHQARSLRAGRRRISEDGAWARAVHLAAPVTAFLYDWNMLPIGQLLWTKELMSYKEFPPLQAPETYNLDGILKQVQMGKPPERLTTQKSAGRASGALPRAAGLACPTRIRARSPAAPYFGQAEEKLDEYHRDAFSLRRRIARCMAIALSDCSPHWQRPRKLWPQTIRLPSWNDGPAKQAHHRIRAGHDRQQASPNFVAAEERIATFDQDGTLWVEHPMYTQVMYTASTGPGGRRRRSRNSQNVEPFKTVLSGDREAMAKLHDGGPREDPRGHADRNDGGAVPEAK